MITLQALDQILKKLLPEYPSTTDKPSGPIDSSYNGLQVEGKGEIKKIGTAVTATLETIEAAITQNIDALIVHHGLFWEKDPPYLIGHKKNKIALLLDHGISLFAYHLPLDFHRILGNNWRAAQEMGWRDCHPFGRFRGIEIGVMGEIHATSPEDLKLYLETYYNHSATVVFGGEKEIHKVALIAGGGSYKPIIEAAQLGCNAFITGSFDEPAWYLAREHRIHFYALGHHATEVVGVKALAKYLNSEHHLYTEFLSITNPF